MHRCKQREKITELPQFKRIDYNSGAKHLQKHSRDLSTIQGFSVLLWHVAYLYNMLQRLLENQTTK